MPSKASKVSDSSNYDASSIEVLEGLDPVRKRPGMYIGSTDSRGLTHLVFEIFDNAVDEALAGHCTKITMTLHEDQSIEIADNGRGIPVDVQKKTGVSALELVFTKLHAGGKFNSNSYAASGGLHGVGAAVVNALSKRLDAEVDRDGKTYAMSFAQAVPGVFDAGGTFTKHSGVRVLGKSASEKTGTRVRYWADDDIFTAGSKVDIDGLYERARQTAFLIPGLLVEVLNERDPKNVTAETFGFAEGLPAFVEFLSLDRPVCDTITITTNADYKETIPVLEDGHMVTREVDRTMEVLLSFRWGVGYDTTLRSFCNIVATPKGGSHVSGFERGLVRVLNEQARTAKVLKEKDDPLVKEDILEGLTAVVLVRLAEPQFEGQTKEILGTPAALTAVSQAIVDHLRDWFVDPKNKAQGRTILQKVAQAAKTRKAIRMQKETIRRKTALESSSMPAKLKDCLNTDENSELFVLEGDSACGTAINARNSEYQAILPIRGKILNVQRATEKKMLDSEECAALITAIGAGSGKSFDLASVRYGKLILLADADVDGAHIRTLLLTLCYNYMYPYLEAGHVYAAVPPLHRIELSGVRSEADKYIYTYTEEGMVEALADLNARGIKYKDSIQRYKGLGEMDAEQLAETTMDRDHRRLRRCTIQDAEEAKDAFEMLMGKDVPARKDFIITNADLVDRARLDV
jgi:DNA gyrase subunit B